MMNSSWHTTNLAAITQRLGLLRHLPDGVIHEETSNQHHIRIIKHAGQVHFYFVDPASGALDGPMSRIDLHRPLHLLAEYTQIATLALLWNPEPAHICLLGCAGGRLSMFFYHYLPAARIDNVDIDPAVARIAADFFGIAFDDRQRIVIQDARAYLDRPTLESSYDTIIMDAFSDSSNNLDHLATVEFYQACRSRMARGGVLCVNMLKSDPQLLAKLKTFQRCFRSVVASERKRSLVLFGTDQHKLPQHALLQRAQVLHKQHDFTFSLPEHAATLEPLRELHWARSDAFREAAVLRDAGIADE